MGRISDLTPVDDGFVKGRFSIELTKEDLASLDGIKINFCSLFVKENREWVNLLSIKEREGPNLGRYRPVVELNGEGASDLMSKIKQAVKGRLKTEPEAPSVFDQLSGISG